MKSGWALVFLLGFMLVITACAPLTQPPKESLPPEEPVVLEPEEPDVEDGGIPQTPPGLIPELTGDMRSCRKDTDCVIVPSGCCTCTSGGGAVAINLEHAAVWEKNLDAKCVDIACPAVMSKDWTCFAAAECVRNKCALVKSSY